MSPISYVFNVGLLVTKTQVYFQNDNLYPKPAVHVLTGSFSFCGGVQGIYRVNGVKTRVEKLCQVFENGKELVELSQCSPHDISNVLKLYLRQVWRRRTFVLRNTNLFVSTLSSSINLRPTLYSSTNSFEHAQSRCLISKRCLRVVPEANFLSDFPAHLR